LKAESRLIVLKKDSINCWYFREKERKSEAEKEKKRKEI